MDVMGEWVLFFIYLFIYNFQLHELSFIAFENLIE